VLGHDSLDLDRHSDNRGSLAGKGSTRWRPCRRAADGQIDIPFIPSGARSDVQVVHQTTLIEVRPDPSATLKEIAQHRIAERVTVPIRARMIAVRSEVSNELLRSRHHPHRDAKLPVSVSADSGSAGALRDRRT
jgi:hypothetical protein